MTLVPLHSSEIRGVEGKPGEVSRLCAAPGCISLTQQRHHLWPRSYLRGQPYEYVRLPDGKVIQNTVGLCVHHHDEVTGGPGGHKAMIAYQHGFLFWAEDKDGKWTLDAPLSPQPEGLEQPPQTEEAHSPDSAEHGVLLPGQTCEHCGYTKPQRRRPGPKRETASWLVHVPADAEIGADVLNDWVDDLAVLLGLGKQPSRLLRYHVLVVALAWVAQNKPQFIRDVKEAGEA